MPEFANYALQEMDQVPILLNSVQYEALIILLSQKRKMTTRNLLTNIRYAYLLDYLSDVEHELWKQVLPDFNDKAKRENIDAKYIIFRNRFIGGSANGPVLREIIELCFPSVTLNEERIVDGVKKFLLYSKKGNTYDSRLTKLVGEINKYSQLKIPSYDKLQNGLEEMLDLANGKGYIQENGAWSLNIGFYKSWEERRKQILEEYEALTKQLKVNKLKGDDFLSNFIDRLDEKEDKKRGRWMDWSVDMQISLATGDVPFRATEMLEAKYTRAVLDFYLIRVPIRRHQSKYLIHLKYIGGLYKD